MWSLLNFFQSKEEPESPSFQSVCHQIQLMKGKKIRFVYKVIDSYSAQFQLFVFEPSPHPPIEVGGWGPNELDSILCLVSRSQVPNHWSIEVNDQGKRNSGSVEAIGYLNEHGYTKYTTSTDSLVTNQMWRLTLVVDSTKYIINMDTELTPWN